MDRPTFFILGATKSGTTTLYRELGRHPDVLMSRDKEPAFFALWYASGLDAYWRAQFAHRAGQRVAGEASTVYLRLPYVARRIREDVPDARLIACLRNPVDRAYAEWWMHRAQALDRRPFERAIVDELAQLDAGLDASAPHLELLVRATVLTQELAGERGLTGYLSAGHYAIQLRAYLELFPRERVKIVLFDDLVSDPQALVRDLCVFLGVDALRERSAVTARNAAGGSGTARLARVPGARRLARAMPGWLRVPLRRALDRATPRPPLHPSTRALLVDYYREHNRALEELLGRDLSAWDR